ncbi:hypothetical protein B0H15DRAFT_806608 [Mycena belliarum]|uniref:Uncharacterized protein n=1 Tax=Mycena belliarum TaxID=1033014 RepID=A0AAD6TQR9_9AGAR|nr:hypothetical protein B0H15DRAFT_806608 [Mycena belliae]
MEPDLAIDRIVPRVRGQLEFLLHSQVRIVALNALQQIFPGHITIPPAGVTPEILSRLPDRKNFISQIERVIYPALEIMLRGWNSRSVPMCAAGPFVMMNLITLNKFYNFGFGVTNFSNEVIIEAPVWSSILSFSQNFCNEVMTEAPVWSSILSFAPVWSSILHFMNLNGLNALYNFGFGVTNSSDEVIA